MKKSQIEVASDLRAVFFDGSRQLRLIHLARRIGVNQSTIWRWINQGVRGKNGESIKLSCMKIGGRMFIDVDSWDRFVAQTSDPGSSTIDEEQPTPNERRLAAEQARRRLEKFGF